MQNIRIYAFADEASSKVDEQIVAMRRNGLNGLEVRGVDGQNISVITTEKAKELKQKLDDAGLVTWSVGSPIGKVKLEDDFNAHLEKFKHTLELANILDAGNLRLFSFFMPADVPAENFTDEVIDRMGKFVELAEGSGVALCHENEKGIYGDIAERCVTIHKALPQIKGIFDPANFVQCDVDTLKAWEMLKPYIHYMHIKDALTDGTVVPAGQGAGNVAKIVKEYIAAGGRDFTIEPHLKVFKGFAELEAAGDKTVIPAFNYPNAAVAFDTACDAFKAIVQG